MCRGTCLLMCAKQLQPVYTLCSRFTNFSASGRLPKYGGLAYDRVFWLGVSADRVPDQLSRRLTGAPRVEGLLTKGMDESRPCRAKTEE